MKRIRTILISIYILILGGIFLSGDLLFYGSDAQTVGGIFILASITVLLYSFTVKE